MEEHADSLWGFSARTSPAVARMGLLRPTDIGFARTALGSISSSFPSNTQSLNMIKQPNRWTMGRADPRYYQIAALLALLLYGLARLGFDFRLGQVGVILTTVL